MSQPNQPGTIWVNVPFVDVLDIHASRQFLLASSGLDGRLILWSQDAKLASVAPESKKDPAAPKDLNPFKDLYPAKRMTMTIDHLVSDCGKSVLTAKGFLSMGSSLTLLKLFYIYTNKSLLHGSTQTGDAQAIKCHRQYQSRSSSTVKMTYFRVAENGAPSALDGSTCPG